MTQQLFEEVDDPGLWEYADLLARLVLLGHMDAQEAIEAMRAYKAEAKAKRGKRAVKEADHA